MLYEARKHLGTQASDEALLKNKLQEINPKFALSQIMSTGGTNLQETKFLFITRFYNTKLFVIAIHNSPSENSPDFSVFPSNLRSLRGENCLFLPKRVKITVKSVSV